ncbi:MAG: DUF3159 domain-containing protein [Actinomycetia bacterium]|nr:DUF3159 domain-containing protein [Actinomycetes bacterium]
MSTEQTPTTSPPEQDRADTVEAVIRQRLATAVGGWRGSLETAVPMVVFVIVWTITHDIRLSAGAALITAALAGALRAMHGGSLQFVVSGFLATGIAAFFALRSGRAEDAFLPGILLSTAYGTAAVVSILTRWPLVGFIVGAGDPRAKEDPFAWRKDPGIVRVATRLTLVVVALYVVRLGVMVPLYLAGNVAALGVARVVLGWPAWVATLAVMGWLLARGQTPIALSEAAERTGAAGESVADTAADAVTEITEHETTEHETTERDER